jgi:hypothetical protein
LSDDKKNVVLHGKAEVRADAPYKDVTFRMAKDL